MDLETRAAETIDTLRTENLRLRDAIGRAEDRIGNVLGALALPLPDRLQVEGLRETLPDIRAELQAAGQVEVPCPGWPDCEHVQNPPGHKHYAPSPRENTP